MRSFATTSILLATLVLGTDAASAAPWCTEYGGGRSGGSNCGFYSFDQCMANAWGNGSFCRSNAIEDPYWTGRTVRGRDGSNLGKDAHAKFATVRASR
jgi:hypothetical protein